MKHTRARSIIRATVSVATTLVLALGVSLVSTPATATAASTSAVLCKGYTGCSDYGMTTHSYSSNNKNMYWRMYGGHNCTNYAAYMMVKAGMANVRPWTTATGNASGWGVGMKSKTNSTPAVGSIAWWTGGSGHVAYVEAVLSPTEIIISEDSWGGDFYWRVINKANGGWPKGFIHFKDSKGDGVVPALRAKPVSTTVWLDAAKTKPAVTSVMNPGKTYWVEQQFQNTGTQAWEGLELSTAAPLAHDSVFATDAWISPNRVVAQSQPLVPTGGVASFVFPVRIPDGLADGTAIAEKFTPALPTGEALDYGTAKLALTADSRSLFSTQPTPAISGSALEERTLSANAGTWKPTAAGATLSYVWKRNGTAIAGATTSTYTLTAADVGRTVSVVVTAKANRYITATKTSNVTAVVASKHDNILLLGESLAKGEELVSLNGRYSLKQTTPGALQIIDRFSGKATWSNKQSGKAIITTLIPEGALHSFSATDKRVWTSKTSNKGVVDAYLTSTGSLRLRDAKGAIILSLR
jgi:surface antigen